MERPKPLLSLRVADEVVTFEPAADEGVSRPFELVLPRVALLPDLSRLRRLGVDLGRRAILYVDRSAGAFVTSEPCRDGCTCSAAGPSNDRTFVLCSDVAGNRLNSSQAMPVRHSSSRRPRSIRQPEVSATEKAYQAIRREILDNTLRSGEPVPVERFVQELQLSRTPVREAILRLERQGMIEIRPRMGTFVSHLDIRQIREMYELRRLLEGHAAKLAASRVPPEAVRELTNELRAFATDGPRPDCRGMSGAGGKLHALILEHCGNQSLAEMLRSMQDHFARFRSVSLQIPEKVISSHNEHLAILEALARGDGEQAETLIHQHFDHAAQLLLESLISEPSRPGATTVVARAAH